VLDVICRDRLVAFLIAGSALVISTVRPAFALDVEVPILVIEEPEPGATESVDDLDLANLVTSAAKTATTVQEAPAIITIVTEEELVDRHPLFLTDVMDTVPGFNRLEAFYGIFPQILARGVLQAVLPLHDEFSMFDPVFNVMSVQRGIPLEMVKRIESISGPGGVLWGANSFLGVVNVITKDPEDVDGVEASAGYGDGEGNRTDFRGYVMAGATELFHHEDWGVLLHASFENFQGPTYLRPGNAYSSQFPNPNSVNFFGPALWSDPQRSTIMNFDAKLVRGRLTLQLSSPYMSRYWSGSLAGETAVGYVPKENQSQVNFFERYALAEYKAGTSTHSTVNVRTYFVQFVREFAPLLGGMPSPLLAEGVAFTTHADGFKAGGSFDGGTQLSARWRMLYGLEAFHEWMPDTSTDSRQGGGAEIDFHAPTNVALLPFPCPREGMWTGAGVTSTGLVAQCPLTFVFAASRSTMGAFTSLQFRPSKRLILDGGVRLQAAPELRSSDVGYGLTPTFSAAAVYELADAWHLKLNYAEGFRPPVFNNTNSNGESVQIDGSADLELETSRAAQFEVNGRVLRGVNRIRELDLRADYAYTTLDNFITFVDGRYLNTSPRYIHSVELLAKLYLKGGHRIELGYTFNQMSTSDKGAFVTMPNNWFNLMSVNRLSARLELASAVRVWGSFEDPNRRVEARGLVVDANGVPTMAMGNIAVQPWEMVIDRDPPAAEVQLGLRWRPFDALQVQATVYNAFNNHRLAYDNSNDLEARIEVTPARFEGFRFFSSAIYAF
jgi:outer membrane receptor protein involved in Fe transport